MTQHLRLDASVAVEGFYSVADVCARFSIGKTKCFELLRAGVFDGRVNGGRTLLTRASVERWAASLPKWRPNASPHMPNGNPAPRLAEKRQPDPRPAAGKIAAARQAAAEARARAAGKTAGAIPSGRPRTV